MDYIVITFHIWNMRIFEDYDGLALFVLIAQSGSLAAAERTSGIPKATLSRRLASLEDRLDVRLARRTRKGVVLTDQGHQLFERGRAAIQLAEEAVAQVRHERSILSGVVRLSLAPDMAAAVLAPALIAFKMEHPQVVVDMTLADRRVSLIEEGFDLVVRMGHLQDSSLMSRRIATLPRLLVASPGFLAAHPSLAVPGDLSHLPALAIRRDIEWRLENGEGAAVLLHPRIEFAANRQTILVEAAIAGLGIANLPMFLVEEALEAGTLVRALPDWQPEPVEMTALWQKDRITGPLVKAIVDVFVEAFRSAEQFA